MDHGILSGSLRFRRPASKGGDARLNGPDLLANDFSSSFQRVPFFPDLELVSARPCFPGCSPILPKERRPGQVQRGDGRARSSSFLLSSAERPKLFISVNSMADVP
jgi:hypothetical protein